MLLDQIGSVDLYGGMTRMAEDSRNHRFVVYMTKRYFYREVFTRSNYLFAWAFDREKHRVARNRPDDPVAEIH